MVPDGFRTSDGRWQRYRNHGNTLDGSDPRLLGGMRSPSARSYQQGVRLTEHARVKLEAFAQGNGAHWPEAAFVIDRGFTDLMISEIMYHPSGEDGVDGDVFEF